MGRSANIALRPLSEAERQELQRVAKASSERVDVVKRAKALLAVADGKTLTQAGISAQLSREGVSHMVERFNQRGLAVLMIARGRGRKPTYDLSARERVVQEVQRQPDRLLDQTVTWSLTLLEQALRKAAFPTSGATTIRRILHEEGYSFQQDRTWCYTGTALRVRKKGVYRVHDPHMQKKKSHRTGLSSSRGMWASLVVSG
jgi:transposase